MAQNVRSKGWVGRVTHPDTSRILRAKALADPRIEPSINTLPRIHLPVPRSQQWQDLNFTTEPAFEAFLDGAEQPIDELTNIRDRREQNATVLVGRGGVELLEEADVEFNVKRRHLAAQEVIQNQTTYDDDVDVPDSEVLADQDMQDPSGESELDSLLLAFASTDPLQFANGGVEVLQTNWIVEAEDFDSETGDSLSVSNDDDFSDGAGEGFRGQAATRSYQFTPGYDVPAGDFDVFVRSEGTSTPPPLDWKINGSDISETTISTDWDPALSMGWANISDFDTAGNLDTLSLSSGVTYTLTVEDTGGGESGSRLIDVISPRDTRFSYNDDNTLNQNQGWLDGPEEKPDRVTIEFLAATSAFQVVSGTVTVTMDSTENSQRIQIRNQVDGTYKPDDGTEDNTSTVTVDPFANAGDRIQLRVGLSRHAENGARNQTPRFGYSAQTLTEYDLDADIREESLMLDYSRDASIEDILTDIAGDEFFWSYRVVNGTKTVTFTQPGQRTGGTEPQLLKADIDQDVETIFEVEVQGSNKTVNGEAFSGSTSYVGLNESDIIPNSESVRTQNGDTVFTRDEDYEMDWSGGRIRITDDGDMVAATTYEISYRAEVKETYTDSSAPANPRTLTVNFPGVTSTRQAEQLAFVLVKDLKDPRWVGDVTIPPSVTDFDVVEALPLTKLGLPSGASPFFIPEPPRQTPRGTEFRLESQPDQQRRIAQLKRQVSEVVQRTG
jgi:hypothetical protein